MWCPVVPICAPSSSYHRLNTPINVFWSISTKAIPPPHPPSFRHPLKHFFLKSTQSSPKRVFSLRSACDDHNRCLLHNVRLHVKRKSGYCLCSQRSLESKGHSDCCAVASTPVILVKRCRQRKRGRKKVIVGSCWCSSFDFERSDIVEFLQNSSCGSLVSLRGRSTAAASCKH